MLSSWLATVLRCCRSARGASCSTLSSALSGSRSWPRWTARSSWLDSSRIARANVHLVPKPAIATSETGTRHRTAERVARSLDVTVITVSEDRSVISVYRGEQQRPLVPVERLLARANQALETLEGYRDRLDVVTNALSALEVEDMVTLRDVITVLAAHRNGPPHRRGGGRLQHRAWAPTAGWYGCSSKRCWPVSKRNAARSSVTTCRPTRPGTWEMPWPRSAN